MMDYQGNIYPDQELKNIIDKLAQFVARNGYEFENMTKQKQKDNPRFSFLFGGDHYNYYQFKVNSEKAFLRQKEMEQLNQHQNLNHPNMNHPNLNHQNMPHQALNQPIPHSLANQLQPTSINQTIYSQPPPLPTPQQNPIANAQQVSAAVCAVVAAQKQLQQKTQNQINELQDQVRQSLDNLQSQHQMLTNQQQLLIDEAIRKIQDEKLSKLAQDFNVNLNEFELVLHPIFETCTKDSISSGKQWISRLHLPVHYEIICKYFLKRIRSSMMPFDHKLHLLYLINDLFNHCNRKGIDSLKQALTSVVVPIYCLTFTESDEENRNRLIKLEKLWDSNKYLDSSVIEQLRNPQAALANYKQSLLNEYGNLVQPITSGTMAKFNQLQQQHNEFVNHQNSKIQQLQISTSLPASLPTNLNIPPVINTANSISQMPSFLASTHSSQLPPFNQPPSTSSVFPMLHQPNQIFNTPPSNMISNLPPPLAQQHLPSFAQPPPQQQNMSNPQMFNQQPPHQPQQNLMQPQSQPYYELPAGLMVPLVKLEDFDYEEIDPKNIRLPLPAPPNERLLRAVEAFYSPPTHERPVNDEGWERLGLYEYYRAKTDAKKRLDDIEKVKALLNAEKLAKESKRKSSSPNHRHSSESSRRSYSSSSISSNSSDYPRRKGKYKRSISSRSSSRSRSSRGRSRSSGRSRSRGRRSRSSSRERSYKRRSRSSSRRKRSSRS